jgi:hypothetical protein
MAAEAEAIEKASLKAKVEELQQERFQVASWKKKLGLVQREKEALEIIVTQQKE